MKDTITLSPIELQSIINAAILEIARNPNSYKNARPKTYEIYKWLISTIWDNPNKPEIIIMERPF